MTAYEILQAAQRAQNAQQPAPVQPAPAPAPAAPKQPSTPVARKSTAVKPVPPQWVASGVAAALQTPTNADGCLSRAMLVAFNCSIPGNEKVDREMTAKVKKEHNLGKQAGKWDKIKFPPTVFKHVTHVAGAVRTWHYANTLRWPMAGLQLLPCKNHGDYCTGMRDWKAQFEAARDTFLSRLPDMIDWAKVEHNGSFDPSLYEEDDLRSRFSFDINFFPVPASDHFVGTIKNLLGQDVAAVDSIVVQAMAKAEEDLWERLSGKLVNITSILAKKDAGDRTRITDSLLGNVLEISRMIPALNVNDNAALAQFAAEAEQAFASLTTEKLATDADARAEAIKAADDILRRMRGVV